MARLPIRTARRKPAWRPHGLALALAAAWTGAGAQVITDGSVGAAVRLNGPNIQIPKTLGRQVGGNLFHSFLSFGIRAGESATFDATGGLANVISRVTGGDPSLIHGTLRMTADPGATPGFYLINPAGVLFGPGSALDVPGAFHVGTADAVVFPDGRFHADPARVSSFSSAAPEAFGFLGAQRAPVIVEGTLLATRRGQALGIAAGDLLVSDAAIGTVGGALRLAAVGDTALDLPFSGALPAGLTGDLLLRNDAQVLSYTLGAADGESIRLAAGRIGMGERSYVYSEVDVGATGRGADIHVAATEALLLTGEANLSSATYGPGSAGGLHVKAGSLQMTDAAYLYSSDAGAAGGRAGAIDVQVTNGMRLAGGANVSVFGTGAGGEGLRVGAGSLELADGSYLRSAAAGAGSTGPVEVTVGGGLELAGGSQIGSASLGWADAGAVRVSAGSLTVTGSTIDSIAIDPQSAARSGRIDVDVGGDVVLNQDGRIQTRSAGGGDAGSVSLRARRLHLDGGSINSNALGHAGASGEVDIALGGTLSLDNGSSIDTSTLSSGAAGMIRVRSAGISLDGASQISSNALDGSGNAGVLDLLTTGALELRNDSSLRSTTATAGDGGAIRVGAASILLDGGSTISSLASASSSGRGGSVAVQTPGTLTMRAASSVVAIGAGSGGAGNVQISAGSLSMDDLANISTVAAPGSSGDAGRVEVSADGAVALANGAFISSDTFGRGSAGRVDVRAHDLEVGRLSFVTSGANVGSEGPAGRVTVQLDGELRVVDGGLIQSSTAGAGSAGAVTVEAARVTVEGLASTIAATARAGSSGQVGNIDIRASEAIRIVDGGIVAISNGATVADARPRTPTSLSLAAPDIAIERGLVSADSSGNVAASDVVLSAGRRLQLDGSAVTTSANAGNGGAIHIASGEAMTVRQSLVRTSVFGTTGNGGDIDIRSGMLLLDTGFIQANTAARNASGGLVRIAADALIASGNTLFLGGDQPFAFDPGVFGFNVIQAAAPTGVSGVIDLVSPVLDLSGSLRVLRADVVDAGGLGRSLCQTSAGSSLALGGRGGLPASSRSWQRVESVAAPPTAAVPAVDLTTASGPLRTRGCL